jgi:hypothetical protein
VLIFGGILEKCLGEGEHDVRFKLKKSFLVHFIETFDRELDVADTFREGSRLLAFPFSFAFRRLEERFCWEGRFSTYRLSQRLLLKSSRTTTLMSFNLSECGAIV